MSKVSFEDFVVEGLVQEGAWGKVFAAKRASDGLPLALKFFGYTKNRPNSVDIANEIRCMSQLIRVEGSVQLIGVFKDSPEGLLQGKNPNWHQSYPVIVMEMLNGGDMLSRLATKKQITEKNLADLFRSAVIAMSSIHKKGFIHRDIKLCNLMTFTTSPHESIQIKLIDFGFMLDLSTAASQQQQQQQQHHHNSSTSTTSTSTSSETVVTDTLVGTEGFFAPESLTKCEYSRMSDIWQLGCVLYTMLVGYHPFSTQKRYRGCILNGSYFPLTALDWQQISSPAKDLVSKLLIVKPCDRLTIEEILKHPWVRSCEGSGSSTIAGLDTSLSEGYHERIKLLASHRLQYLPDRLSLNELADTKPSQLPIGSAEKKQKLDHNTNEGNGEPDSVKFHSGDGRSPSPILLRSDLEMKTKAEDRVVSVSPSIEKISSEEQNLQHGR